MNIWNGRLAEILVCSALGYFNLLTGCAKSELEKVEVCQFQALQVFKDWLSNIDFKTDKNFRPPPNI